MSNIASKKRFPERLALMINTSSLLLESEAIELLGSHGIRVVDSIDDSEKNGVAAIILGDQHFGARDAAEYPLLRTVARFGSGVDNVDFNDLWKERRILTTAVTGASTQEVAEYALSLITLSLRNAPVDSNALRSSDSVWRAGGRGKSLRESVIGVIGLGRIGQQVAQLLNQFGARVIGWNRTWPLPDFGIDPSFIERVNSIEEMAAQCDAVSIHLALTDETRHFVGKPFFDAVEASDKHLSLVNTARGAICNPTALLAALDDGWITSACIDVWSSEHSSPSEVDRALQVHGSVLPSCHIAANTLSTRKSYAIRCAKNIVAAVEGRYSNIDPQDCYPRAL